MDLRRHPTQDNLTMREPLLRGGTSSGTGDGPGGGAPATGYTVIEADSLDAAVAKCENHPHINHGGDVAVYTCIDMSPQQ